MLELADVFCELYDQIDLAIYRSKCDGWLADDDLHSDIITHRNRALHSTPAWAFHEAVEGQPPGEERERARFAVLSGLDEAFVQLHPVLADDNHPQLAMERARVAATGRLDSGKRDGALLYRVAAHQARVESDHPREAFAAVVRVEPEAWERCAFGALDASAKFDKREFEAGIKVGCVPFIEDPDEMVFETGNRDGKRVYRIRPADKPQTLARVEAVLEALIAEEVQIGLLPELTLTPALLAAWQDALRTRKGKTGRLEWVLVGSGDLGAAARPTNTGVLLDARTGQMLASQDKMYPFDMDETELERWKLTDRLGSEPIAEDLEPGVQLGVLEAGVFRLAVLVCEDLARVLDNGRYIRSFGVSHLAVPVFARATKDHRWEHTRAVVHCENTGSTVVVANSRVMHSIDDEPDKSGTCLAAWPGDFQISRSTHEVEVCCFTVGMDGSVS